MLSGSRTIRFTASDLPSLWDGAAGPRRSKTLLKKPTWIGKPSKSWTSSTWASNSVGSVLQLPRSLGWTKLPYARDTPIASLLVTFCAAARSGLGVRTVQNRAWMSSFTWLGPKKSKQIRLAVMDMWKAFRKSTLKPEHAPGAAILFDKFHVLRHLSDALDQVRKREYGLYSLSLSSLVRISKLRACVFNQSVLDLSASVTHQVQGSGGGKDVNLFRDLTTHGIIELRRLCTGGARPPPRSRCRWERISPCRRR